MALLLSGGDEHFISEAPACELLSGVASTVARLCFFSDCLRGCAAPLAANARAAVRRRRPHCHSIWGVLIREVGGCSTGKSFRFVRARVRAVWLPGGIGSQKTLPVFSLFPFGSEELSLFPFGGDELPFSFPPNPQTSQPWVHGFHGWRESQPTSSVLSTSLTWVNVGPFGEFRGLPVGPNGPIT